MVYLSQFAGMIIYTYTRCLGVYENTKERAEIVEITKCSARFNEFSYTPQPKGGTPMKKIVILFASLFALLLLLPRVPFVVAAATPGAGVTVRIEGVDASIAYGDVYAYTFREALESLAAACELTLTFTTNGTQNNLYSIGEETEVEAPGQWLGYIQRGDEIIRQEAYLELPLQNGDALVLYRGDPENTLIITHFTIEATDSGLVFFVGADCTDWIEEDGIWEAQTFVQPTEGVTVHVLLPSGELTATTDETGYCTVEIETPCVFAYYAEGYRSDATPLCVRTAKQQTTYGFEADTVTRAEAVAFFVAMLNIPRDQPIEIPFNDVDEATRLYEAILAATTAEWVVGYEDGTFRPGIPMDWMQMCVLAERMLPERMQHQVTETEDAIPDILPDWAVVAANSAIAAGLLDGIEAGWTDAVTVEMLLRFYENTLIG